MAGRILNALLALTWLALLALYWALPRDPTGRNREFFPDMVRTARYNAFSPNPNFPDGKTLQRPVPGTIPRGDLPLHYQATPEDAARAGLELQNPLTAGDLQALQRGETLFKSFCVPCHGSGGRGDGPVVLRGFPAPPPLVAAHAVQLKDGQLFHILTYGQNNLASYATQLAREDRWKVILFVRSLQQQTAAAQGGQQ